MGPQINLVPVCVCCLTHSENEMITLLVGIMTSSQPDPPLVRPHTVMVLRLRSGNRAETPNTAGSSSRGGPSTLPLRAERTAAGNPGSKELQQQTELPPGNAEACRQRSSCMNY